MVANVPTRQKSIFEVYFLIMIYFLAAMPPLDGRTNHKGCTAQRCIAHGTDGETYCVEHVHDCSQYEMTGPDLGKLQSIVENGGIPFDEIQRTSLRRLGSGRCTGLQMGYIIPRSLRCGLVALAVPQCQLTSIRKGESFLITSSSFSKFS